MGSGNMQNHDNMQTGLEGEQWVSEALDELGHTHNHHDFSSVEAYSRTQGKGVDIWSCSLNFYIEAKHFPHSYLCGTEGYYVHVKSRFRDIPINGFKLVVQIGGWKNRSFIAKLKQMGIYYIYVDDPKKLVSKLGYFLRIHGIISDKDDRPHKRTSTHPPLEPLKPSVPALSPVFVSDEAFHGKGPPNITSNLSVSGSWISLGGIAL